MINIGDWYIKQKLCAQTQSPFAALLYRALILFLSHSPELLPRDLPYFLNL